jgi:hypothetical protein
MRRSIPLVALSLITLLLALTTPAAAEPPERCVAGELLLPALEGWIAGPTPDLPAGREGCLLLRPIAEDTIGGLMSFRATPKDTAGVADAPHPRLMMELIEQLKEMNIGVGEPQWRRQDVRFDGVEGFGNGTMFGFDGEAIEGGERSEVILFFFDGPDSHFDLLFFSEPAEVAPENHADNIAGFRQLLAGLNKAKRRDR